MVSFNIVKERNYWRIIVSRFFKTIGKIFAVLILSLLIFLAIIFGYMAGSMIKIAADAPKIDTRQLLSDLKENSIIVDQNGQLVQRIETAEYRKIVPYEQIPEDLIHAFISAEDKRFWDHGGIDPIGILATMRDYAQSGDLRGASTITMQLARNVFLNYNVSWERKIQEMYLSRQMESLLTEQLGKTAAKKKIMEGYLNRIFFGQNAYGVQAASQIYFSKNVEDLTLPECAAIASIVPAPSYYSLYSTYRPSHVTDERILGETFINGERYICVFNAPAYKRAKWVLKEMYNNGYISAKEYEDAIATDVAASIKPPAKQAENVSTYITDLIKDQAAEILVDTMGITDKEAHNLILYGGLTITTTLDMDLQQRLQESASSVVKSFTETETGVTRPLQLDLQFDKNKNMINEVNEIIYYKKENLVDENNQVILPKEQFEIRPDGSLSIHRGRVRAYPGYLELSNYYTLDDKGVLRTHQVGSIPIPEKFLKLYKGGEAVITGDFFKNNKEELFRIREDGSLVFNSNNYKVDEIGVMQPQFAATVVDTKTGEIRAIIGGRENDKRHFLNRAYASPRQPGSAIKPIAEYTGAFALGFNEGCAQDDAPFRLLDDKPWPQNVTTNRYMGLTSMKKALEYSLNPCAVRWLDTVGMEVTKEYLSRYGVIDKKHPDRDHFIEKTENSNNNDENLSLALGAMTKGLTTLDMAEAYQAIGNGGKHIRALSISKIVNNTGKVYFENKHEENEVLPPEVNYQLLDCLRFVAKGPFVGQFINKNTGIDLAGKTGNSSKNVDFWFCGVTPYYSTSVWMGADNAQIHMVGDSTTAVSLYSRLSKLIYDGKAPVQYKMPEGLYEVEVCMLSGKKPTEACKADPRGMVKKILVSKQTEPKTECDLHVFQQVDPRNNLLASPDTPEAMTIKRVFTRRKPPYDPVKFKNIIPEDWAYEVPSALSSLPPDLKPTYELQPDGSIVKTYYSEEGNKIVKTLTSDHILFTVYYGPMGEEVNKTQAAASLLEVMEFKKGVEGVPDENSSSSSSESLPPVWQPNEPEAVKPEPAKPEWRPSEPAQNWDWD